MANRPPPLLLTKRLTSFLHLNLSATITTLLLLTPSGKLLAYASAPPVPVATLRTHGTVAASLYTIHSSGTDRETIEAALGPAQTGSVSSAGGGSSGGRRAHDESGPLAVTIQLDSGAVLVIRKLRCGMLFVCMGPPDGASPSRPQTTQNQQNHHHHHHHQQQQQQASVHSLAGAIEATSSSSTAAAAAAANGHHTPSTSPPSAPAHPGSPSEVASILSTATAQTTASSATMFGAGTAGVMSMRRHAEELARWLDDKLGTLEVPGDGLGGVV